jgi:phosphoesterase RecJ-like protein
MISSDLFKQTIDLINKSERILITTHTKPDGDALGCIVAMSEVLRSFDKEVKPLILSPAPQWYQFILDEKIPILGEDIQVQELKAGRLGEFDLVMILDTNSPGQLPEFSEYLQQIDISVLVIDHHRTADGLGAVELVESDAAATGLVVLDLLKYANWSITKKIAEALFIAISTDTGWFQFNNTDSRVFVACSELIQLGAKPSAIYNNLYENFSKERFQIRTIMLNTLELHLDNRCAIMHISQQDFEKSGATYADTENLINETRRMNSVDTSVLFIELGDGRIRCSLRSKGAVDVGRIAEKFGGGGHKMAAGTFIPGPIEKAKQAIISEFETIYGYQK